MTRNEQRQHINLSQYAWAIIESDRIAFNVEPTLSGFLNQVIENCIDNSQASISVMIQKKYAEYEEALLFSKYKGARSGGFSLEYYEEHRGSLGDSDKKILECLINHYADELKNKMNSFPKGKTAKIRLRNRVYDFLHPLVDEQWPEARFYPSRGDYIKALIEDYATQSFYNREAIVFKSTLDRIQSELELPSSQRRIMALAQKTSNGIRWFDVKPSCLMADSNTNYHYLVCLSKPSGEPGPLSTIASFRISRIADIKERSKSAGSGKISVGKQKEINKALEERGVQYLVGDPSDVVIRLSKEGLRLYNSILHMRPPATEISEEGNSVLMRFSCTNLQAANYFFRFGADAEILAPSDLRQSFEEKYRAAADVYCNKTVCE